ncbi:hypothetical protein ACMGD3_00490 [Lysinibacillus sphaericus]|uniref:hypothetical protein n=1 Tax=Lysinibacillus sphaericus TaxID=1421 RepID=UPI003F78DA03
MFCSNLLFYPVLICAKNPLQNEGEASRLSGTLKTQKYPICSDQHEGVAIGRGFLA